MWAEVQMRKPPQQKGGHNPPFTVAARTLRRTGVGTPSPSPPLWTRISPPGNCAVGEGQGPDWHRRAPLPPRVQTMPARGRVEARRTGPSPSPERSLLLEVFSRGAG